MAVKSRARGPLQSFIELDHWPTPLHHSNLPTALHNRPRPANRPPD